MEFFAVVLRLGLAGPVLVVGRSAGLCLFAPFLGSRRIPGRLRLALALVLALPLMAAAPVATPATAVGLAGALAGELVLGALMATFVALVFEAYRMVGVAFDTVTGLGAVTAPDPIEGGESQGLVGRLALLMAGLVFLGTDAHHALIRALAESFRLVPAGRALPLVADAAAPALVAAGAGAFAAALRFVLPGFFLLFLVELFSSLVARAFPGAALAASDRGVRSLVGAALACATLLVVTPMVGALVTSTLVELGTLGGA